MIVKEILSELSQLNVKLDVIEGNLDLIIPKKVQIPGDLIAKIRAEKDNLIAYVEAVKIQSHSINRVLNQSSYKLSSAQERLWILSQSENGSVAYNMPLAFRFKGAFDFDKFKRAFELTIDRHESLRTVFGKDEEGLPKQFIKTVDEIGFELGFVDFSNNENPENSIAERIDLEVSKAFNLETGPLLRATILKKSETEHVLSFVMHHIISDAWSLEVFTQELLTIYNGEIRGVKPKLEELTIQYKDYAAWQQNQLSGVNFERHKNYWLEQLSGELPVVDLLGQKSRPAIKTFNGNVVSLDLDKSLVGDLKKFALEQGGTLYTALVSIVNILLYRYTGQNDLIVGSPTAGRSHNELKNQIGFFVNTLALRGTINPKDSFETVFKKYSKTVLKALEHEVFPFDHLVDELNPHRDLSRSPIFDIMLVLQNAALESSAVVETGLENLQVEPLAFDSTTSKFDLTFNFYEGEDELALYLEYNTDIYSKAFVQQLIQHFHQLLKSLLSSPNTALSEITFLSTDERDFLIHTVNKTRIEYAEDLTIVSAFKEQVSLYPDKRALVSGNRAMTYLELDQESDRLAAYLQLIKGTQPEEKIAIRLERSEWIIIAILATLKVGGVYVPVDTETPDQRMEFILKDGNIEVLIDDVFLKTYSESKFDVNEFEEYEAKKSDLAYLMYTSGTTGKPKGTLIEQKSVLRLVKTSNFIELSSSDTVLVTGSPAFDSVTFEYWSMLLNGGTLLLRTKNELLKPESMHQIMNEEKVSVMWLTASWFNEIFDELPDLFSNLKAILIGGDKLSPSHIAQLRGAYPNLHIVNGYGPTENTTFSLCGIVGEEINGNIPIGKPVNNSTVYIVDEAMNLQPIESKGEILVGGDGLARGYQNLDELTAEKFIDNPFVTGTRVYRTGDIGKMDAQGNVYFLGRKDNQIKIRGYRIEPGEVENVLLSHAEVEKALVLGIEKGIEKELVAYFVANDELSVDAVKQHLRKQVPTYMIPSHFVKMESFPLTVNGKVNRSALPKPDGTHESNYIAPKTEMEKLVADIWKRVLKYEKVGINNDFFELGGHSLRAIRLLSFYEKDFGVKLTIENLFEHPTLAEQVELIGTSNKTKFLAIPKAENKPYYPLSSAQNRMLFLQEFAPESTSYNIPLLNYLGKEVELDRLQNALNVIVKRHESLRTSFVRIDGEPYQKIVDNIQLEIQQFETSVADFEALLDKVNQPFDLSKAPLMNSALIHVANVGYFWLVNVHHIISDGTSHEVLIEEFMQVYEGGSLKPLSLQYKDFSEWQHEQNDKGAFDNQKRYWLKQLSGNLPVLNIPNDFMRPETFTFEGAYYNFEFSQEKSEQLKVFTKEQGLTLQITLLSALNILFHKYTGNQDVILGTSIAGRRHPDLERVVGMFVNSLAMRNFPSPDKSIIRFLQEVKETSLEAYENQDIQFEDLVDMLNVRREPSRNPIFDVSLVIQNFEEAQADTTALTGEELPAEMVAKLGMSRSSKFDMTWFAFEEDGKLKLVLEYYSAIYSESSIRRFASHFQAILSNIMENPFRLISDINLISIEDEKSILQFASGKLIDFDSKNSVRHFELQVEKNPNNTAVRFGEQHLSYLELNQQADQLAAFLLNKCRAKTKKIGVLQDRTSNIVLSVLAILKAGGVYVPLDAEYPVDRLEYIIEDAGITTLLINENLIELGNKLQWRCSILSHLISPDSVDFYAGMGSATNELMREDLWDHVGGEATNLINGGGWMSSYTGEDMTDLEMKEYSDNVYFKLEKYLSPETKVLEVGCSSGLTMFRIAPLVAEYHGIDLSAKILENTGNQAKEKGLHNIRLTHAAAHELDKVVENEFDVIIINSVIHCFSGVNYLRQVLNKVLEKSADKAIVFLGDLMDEEKREELIDDLNAFKAKNTNPEFRTKTDWSSELFVHKDFLSDFVRINPSLISADFTDKIRTVENELTKFRFDAILIVNKNVPSAPGQTEKQQYDLKDISLFKGLSAEHNPFPEDPAYIIYTSGSTGQPKGVVVTHAAINNYLNWAIDYYRKQTEDTYNFGLFTSISFDLTLTSMFLPLLSGGTLEIFRQDEITTTLKDYFYHHSGLNIIKLTPSHIRLMESLGLVQTGLKTVIVGGEALSLNQIQTLRKMNPEIAIYNEYGPTEATVGCIVWNVESSKPILIGRPVANTRVILLDETGAAVPVGMTGEICVAGAGLALEYHNHPELTADRFVYNAVLDERVYKTGDIGRLRADGNFEYLGRKDEQIKIRGYRIEPEEVEKAILENPAVSNVSVISAEIDDEKELVAYVVANETADLGSLKQNLVQRLPIYMIPTYFVALDELPLTVNGKLDKRALPPVEKNGLADDVPFIDPKNNTEKQLLKIWKKILGLDRISVIANFFVIGGHSLRATRLTSLCEQELGVRLNLKSIFDHPTIREQAILIDQSEKNTFVTIEKAEEKEHYALSSAQKRLFFINEIDPESTSYNMPLVQFLGADVSKERVEDSFKMLVNRHEGLRTSFVKIDGEPYQKINEDVSVELEYFECSPSEYTERLNNFVRPFDLSKAPLARLGLAKVEGVGFALMIDEHHIISDGTSHQMLTDEFLRLYQGEKLAPIKLQYKDFSEWQNKLLNSDAINEQKAYWKSKFEDKVPVLNLPADRPRPRNFNFSGDRVGLELDKETYSILMQIGRENGATLQMTLLTILNILLYKKSGQRDVIIGCGIAGRRHADLENVYGMFVNSLPIRNQIKENQTFLEFYKTVINNCLEAYDNQDVQFEDLVDFLKIDRDPSRNPIFDVLLVVQNFERSEMAQNEDLFLGEIEEKDGEMIDYQNKTSKFDMTFFVWEGNEEVYLSVEYYAAIFNRETIELFLHHFVQVIQGLKENRDFKIDALNSFGEGELNRVLNVFSKGSQVLIENSETIQNKFETQAHQTPQAVAVQDKNGKLTYAELNNQSNQLAGFLSGQLKTKSEERIGILQYRTNALISSMIGILKSGGAYAVLDPSLPEERLIYIIHDSNIQTILVDNDLVGLAEKLLWRSNSVKNIVAVNSENIALEHGGIKNQLMDKELWDHVGDNAEDAIEAGGWLSSYTGLPISKTEMDEYSENAYLKLKPILKPQTKVLEVGCSSGLTLFKVAPVVERYVGTDLSSEILKKTRRAVDQSDLNNVRLECTPADQIDQLNEGGFDLVIINSVIQCFEDYNYLRDVLHKAINLMGDNGYLFLGDLMDEDKRSALIQDLNNFRLAHKDKGYRTKIDWSSELFISRTFLADFVAENPVLIGCDFSDKIKTVDNELTKFRFDALLTLNKKNMMNDGVQEKHRYDLNAIRNYSVNGIKHQGNKHNLCYVIYTSGTTGQPKGVLIEHASVLRLVHNKDNFVPFTSENVVLATGASSFDATTFEYWGMLLNGGRLILAEKEDLLDTEKMKKNIRENGVNMMWFTASWLNELVDNDIELFKGLNFILAGGDKLSPKHIRKLKETYPELIVVNGYGPTENTTFSLTHKLYGEITDTIPIGKPILNSSAYILDEYDQPVGIGIIGEIVLGGEGLARAYQNHESLTHEKFFKSSFSGNERLYRSGDLGRWNLNGEVEFHGRKDDQVKIRGFRVELGEVENALKSLPQVNKAVAIKNPDIEAFTVFITSDLKGVNPEEILIELEDKLPEHMIPVKLIQVDQFPLTTNGKTDKKALLALIQDAEPKVVDDTPMTDLEKEISQIWRELLGKENVTAFDDFFKIGGHSLKAISLISSYSKRFGVKVSLKDIFDKTTVREHAELFADSAQEVFEQIPTSDLAEDYPVSHAQQRLWILSQFEEGSAAYNMPFENNFEGEFYTENFERAIHALIGRHESLRTVFFKNEKDQIRQRILPAEEMGFKLNLHDYRSKENPEKQAEEYIAKDRYVLFDLENGPLIRAHLFRLKTNEYLFYFNMHHIISDGWSVNIMQQDLMAFYEAFNANKEVDLAPLRIQYKDYSAWHESQLEKVEAKEQLNFWKQTLSGSLPVIDLPAMKFRPLIKTNNGHSLHTFIDAELTRDLKEYASEKGQSIFMTTLAILNVLLYKYSGQKDLIIGTPSAGREHEDLKGQIGFYVNTVALRNSIDPNLSFNDFGNEVREKVIKAFDNQSYPFDLLVDTLNLERNTARSPIFDVMLSLQNIVDFDFEIPADENLNDITDLGAGMSLFDIEFSLQEVKDVFSFGVDFNPDVYDLDLVKNLMRHFKQLLAVILKKPSAPIAELDILSDSEKQELVVGLNPQEKQFSSISVIRKFEEQVLKNENSTAISYQNSNLTYGELNAEANRLAHFILQSYEIEKDDLIAVKMDRSDRLLIAILAVFKMGAAYVPVDPNFPDERIAYILSDANPKCILDEEFYNHFETAEIELSVENLSVEIKEDQLAYVIYTSGSTGRPKGVLIEHSSLSGRIEGELELLSVKGGICSLHSTNFIFDVSLLEFFMPLTTGGQLVIPTTVEWMEPKTLMNLILKHGVNVIQGTPGFVSKLLTGIDSDMVLNGLNELQFCIGGESLGQQLVDTIKKWLPEAIINNHYGPTETTIDAIVSRNVENMDVNRIGKPLPGNKVLILDEHNQIVPLGVQGEITISGIGVARGYLNQPELTQEVFIEHPLVSDGKLYKTGDLGQWLPDGTLVFSGRADDQIKVRGYRIELGEVEYQLRLIDEVSNAIVIVEKNDSGENELIAFLETSANLSAEDVRYNLIERIPEYMIPTAFVTVEQFPLAATGKIDKEKLKSSDLEFAAIGSEYIEPRNVTETKLAEIWQDVLSHVKIGVKDDFFVLGGHSLKAIKMLSAVNSTFGLNIQLAEVYSRRTIEDMATLIKHMSLVTIKSESEDIESENYII